VITLQCKQVWLGVRRRERERERARKARRTGAMERPGERMVRVARGGVSLEENCGKMKGGVVVAASASGGCALPGVVAPSAVKNLLGQYLASSDMNPVIKLVSGMAGGVAEACTLQPLDLAKTRIQLDNTGEYRGMFDCIGKVARTEGILALYSGLSPFVTHLTLKYALRFAGFEKIKMLMGADKDGNASNTVNFFAGLTIGCIEATLIVTPFEVIKTRLQKERKSVGAKRLYSGPFSVVKHIMFKESPKRLWSGNIPTVIRQGSNQAFNFSTMAVLNKWVWDKKQGDGKEIPIWGALLNGLIAGAVGPMFNTPVDVVKSRLMAQDYSDPNNLKYKGWFSTMQTIAEEEGVSALWKGLVPRLARISPGQSITWGVVMTVSTQLERIRIEYEESQHFRKEQRAASKK